MTGRREPQKSPLRLTRTGSVLDALTRVGSDLTDHDLTAVFEPCVSLRNGLAEAAFVVVDDTGEIHDLCVLAVVDSGQSLGVSYGSTSLLISMARQPGPRELAELSKVVEAFRASRGHEGMTWRLMLRLRDNLHPCWPPPVRVISDGLWYEVLLEPPPGARTHRSTDLLAGPTIN